MKTRLTVIWAAIVAAGVTIVGVLTGRRRKRREERRKAREARRAKKAQRRAQGGGRRPGGTPVGAEAPIASATPAMPAPVPPPPAPSSAESSSHAGDDLRAIKGLGAVAAEKLAGAGITTYAQIAAWTPEVARDVALRLELQPGRIASDDWVGQARALLDARDEGPTIT